MKSIYILFTIFAVFVFKVGHAQDFEGELGLGYNIQTIPTDDHVNGGRGGFAGTLALGYFPGEFISVGAMYMVNKWGYATATGNIDLALPAHSFNVYMCKHYRLPNLQPRPRYSEFCLRPYAGYTLVTKGSPYVQYPVSYGYTNNYKGGGFNIGLQTELLFPISKLVSAFLNLGAGVAFINGKNTREFKNYPDATLVEKIPLNIGYYMITIGGVYRLWE